MRKHAIHHDTWRVVDPRTGTPVRQGLPAKPENALSGGDCNSVRARNLPWANALRFARLASCHIAGAARHTPLLEALSKLSRDRSLRSLERRRTAKLTSPSGHAALCYYVIYDVTLVIEHLQSRVLPAG